MSGLKIVAIVLIVAGIAGLVYGKFTYTKATHEAKIGSLDLSIKEKQTVNIPMWAGIAAIAAGALLLFVVYIVGLEQGATAILGWTAVHEWVHDSRHLLGFPCH
jgi:cobalt transporter subunit CbtB